MFQSSENIFWSNKIECSFFMIVWKYSTWEIRNWIFQMRKSLVITKWTGIRNVVVSLKAPFDDVVTMLQVLTRLAWNWNCPESKLIAWKENTYFSLQATATNPHLSWFSRVQNCIKSLSGMKWKEPFRDESWKNDNNCKVLLGAGTENLCFQHKEILLTKHLFHWEKSVNKKSEIVFRKLFWQSPSLLCPLQLLNV